MAKRKRAAVLKTEFRLIALYARISNEDRRDAQGRVSEESVSDQLVRLRAEAARRWPGVHVVEYVDNDLSASAFATKPRKQFDAMVQAFLSNDLDLVISTRLDRLTRNGPDGHILADAVLKHGGAVSTLLGDQDLTSDGGFNYNLNVLLAERESAVLSWRVRNKLELRREQGVYRSSRIPFGYADTACTQVVKSQGDLLQKMRKHVITVGTLAPCERMLIDAGVVSPTKKKDGSYGPYTRQAIQGMLRNPLYAGFVPHEGKKFKKSTHIVPIFTEPEFDALQLKLDEIADVARSRRPKPAARVHVLAGFVRCGKPGCGGRMRVRGGKSGPGWACEACHGSWRKYDTVKEVVDAFVRTRLAVMAIEVQEEVMSSERAVKLAEELAELEKRRTGLMALHADPAASLPEDYFELLTALRDAITTRQSEQARMVRDAGRALPPDALAIWDDDRPEMLDARRAVLADVIDHIVILPAELPPGRHNWGRKGAPRETISVRARRTSATAEVAA